MKKARITYILTNFPQISETYIRSELQAISDEYDIQILSYNPPNISYRNHLPYQYIQDPIAVEEAIEAFQPDILHTHWLNNIRDIAWLAGYFSRKKRQIPFTIRAHSFDTLDPSGKYILESASLINSELCLGVLTFPFTRPILEKAGIISEKIYDCYPVVDFRRFYDRTPNGNGVMNVTSALPKKKLSDFLELSSKIPNRTFNLYCYGGYLTREIERLNQEMGNPVNLMPAIEPEEMPKEYKKHEWLVYTGSREANLVGWPIAVAEAQAGGTGVCFPNLRPDLKEYLGGAGFLYDSLSEVAEIISKPYPQEMREKGFEQARKSDIFQHKYILTDLWQQVIDLPSYSVRSVCNSDTKVAVWGTSEASWGLENRYQYIQYNRLIVRELHQAIPIGEKIIMVGDPQEQLGDRFPTEAWNVLPFLEHNGMYWGLPPNDKHALRELERLRESGASYIVFSSMNFWWFDYYTEFYYVLRNQFPCLLENERLAIFLLK
jgi:glycosyltransferase involved in cell wall biosynthesis